MRERIDTFHLWPENEDAWHLFHACGTQWRSSFGGREGMDYDGVHHVIDTRRIWRNRRRLYFTQVQIMERAALRAWGEKVSEHPR